MTLKERLLILVAPLRILVSSQTCAARAVTPTSRTWAGPCGRVGAIDSPNEFFVIDFHAEIAGSHHERAAQEAWARRRCVPKHIADGLRTEG